MPKEGGAIRRERLERILEIPWKRAEALSREGSDVREWDVRLGESLAAMEDRVRTDYTGRYAAELVQNAHDACADADTCGNVILEVTPTALLVANEGKAFDEERLRAIMLMGASSKSEEQAVRRTIGYKGIGFTSVFEICDVPQLFSRDVAFQFDRKRATRRLSEMMGVEARSVPARSYPHRLVLEDAGPDAARVSELLWGSSVTVIRLPFRPGVDPRQVASDIEGTLSPEILVFMPSLASFEVITEDAAYRWRVERGEEIGAGQVVHLCCDDGTRRSWLTRSSSVKMDSHLAEELNDDLWSRVEKLEFGVGIPWCSKGPDPDRPSQRLHVFFPSDDDLGRSILIHGDFYIDSSRKHIEQRGAGAELSKTVASEAAFLLGELAESIASYGARLLSCFGKRGPSSGFGSWAEEHLIERLRATRLVRWFGGDELVSPRTINRLGHNLGLDRAKRIASMCEDPDVLVDPKLAEGRADEVLEELGCLTISSDRLASMLDPSRSGLEYRQCLDDLSSLVAEMSFVGLAPLKKRPILRSVGGLWLNPEDAFKTVEGLPPIPECLGIETVDDPGTDGARSLFEKLDVRALQATEVLRRALECESRDEDDLDQILHFLRQLWRLNRTVFSSSSKIKQVRLPSSRADGTGVEWRPAGQVYFSRRWRVKTDLEALYGPFSEPDFLALDPPASPEDLMADIEFLRALGVSDEPRLVPIESVEHREVVPGSWPIWDWKEEEVHPKDPCRGEHVRSTRKVEGKVIDRLELILCSGDPGAFDALATFLLSSIDLTGGACFLRCSHGSHAGKEGTPVTGFQQWLLQSYEWIPVDGDPLGRDYVRPLEAWADLPPSARGLAIPQAKFARADATKLGLVIGTSPPSAAVERLLESLSERHPDLAEAPQQILSTAFYLLERLEASLHNERRGEAVRESPPLPAWMGEVATWSRSPVVADRTGLDGLSQLARLPHGPWRQLRRFYGLQLASDEVLVSVRGGAQRPGQVLTRERRVGLTALASRRGKDLRALADLIAGIEEYDVDGLTLALTWGGEEVVVPETHCLTDRGARDGSIGEVAELYIDAESTQEDLFPKLGSTMADYLGQPELGETIAVFLFSGPGFLTAEGISNKWLAEAAEALSGWAEPEAIRRTPPDEGAAIEAGAMVGESQGETARTGETVDGGRPRVGEETGEEGGLEAPRSGTGQSPAQTQPDLGGGSGIREGDGLSVSGIHTPVGDRAGTSGGLGGVGGRERGERQCRFVTYVETSGEASAESDAEAAEERRSVERAGIAAVIEFERSAGREPVEMPYGNQGYDIQSLAPDGEVERLIEVKSTSGVWGSRGVTLTVPEYDFARRAENRDRYWLYVVEDATAEFPGVYAIHNPLRLVNQYAFDDGWKGAAVRDRASKPSEELDALDLVVESLRPLLAEYVGLGRKVPEVGYEAAGMDGWQVELAWPDEKVAVVVERDEVEEARLQAMGWEVLPADGLSVDRLDQAVRTGQGP